VPQCQIHDIEMTYRPPGISKKSGKPYSASYRCGFQGCPSIEWIPDSPPPQTVAAPPSRIVGPQSRDRMIYAQTAIKAACELCTEEAAMKRLAMEFFAAFERVEKGQSLHFMPISPPAQAMSVRPTPAQFDGQNYPEDKDINF